MSLTVGSLFAGIGGFDLAAERVGFEVKWQVEIDPFCRKVLEKHWPHVRRYEDVRFVEWADVEPVDLVCGGFPCQPHSSAGKRLAAADDRDLWPEYKRCIRTIMPGWVVAENVSGILSSDAGRFFGGVLRDLVESGYDTEWDCIPAAAVGAPHRRDRVWIVAYPTNDLRRSVGRSVVGSQDTVPRQACGGFLWERDGSAWHARSTASGAVVADADSARLPVTRAKPKRAHRIFGGRMPSTDSWWATESDVGRVAHGVPARVDRLRGLGNAIVPQVAQWIFEQIKAAEASHKS